MKLRSTIMSFLIVSALLSCKVMDNPLGYDPTDPSNYPDIIGSSVRITFKGKVVKAEDGSPIKGARIKIDTFTTALGSRYSDSVSTDEDGRYSLYYEGTLGPKYSYLLAEADGFIRSGQEIQDFTAKIQVFDFELLKK